MDNLATESAMALLSKLPQQQAEVILLRVVAGLDTEAVAEILGRTPGNVRVAAHRGLKKLETLLVTGGCNALTRFGVPDDDMPDSLLPPGWGPAPFDERDLDAVLSGERPTPGRAASGRGRLASLRAGPVPAELYGEADARAAFRALGLARPGGRRRPCCLRRCPPAREPGQGGGRRGTGVRPARRHPLRRASCGRGAVGAAAAAVIVVAVLVTGNFVGPLPGYRAHGQPVGGCLVRDGSARGTPRRRGWRRHRPARNRRPARSVAHVDRVGAVSAPAK